MATTKQKNANKKMRTLIWFRFSREKSSGIKYIARTNLCLLSETENIQIILDLTIKKELWLEIFKKSLEFNIETRRSKEKTL